MTQSAVTLDFTISQMESPVQDLAVMPASLAKKLLKLYAKSLASASVYSIIQEHVSNLGDCSSIEQSLVVSSNYISERTLIQNVMNENWDAYQVKSKPDEENAPFDEEIPPIVIRDVVLNSRDDDNYRMAH